MRRPETGGYVVSERSAAGTSVALTATGRTALDDYSAALRSILDGF
jgi:hypothetical protein